MTEVGNSKGNSPDPERGYVCIFAGLQHGANEAYERDARTLGRLLAERGFGVVYGGNNAGLAGSVADEAQKNGATILAVLLGIDDDAMRTLQTQRPDMLGDRFISEPTLERRKRTMLSRAVAAIALPGGLGTNDEIATALELGRRLLSVPSGSKLIVLNTLGFYAGTQQQIEAMESAGFMKNKVPGPWFANTPEEAVDHIEVMLGEKGQ